MSQSQPLQLGHSVGSGVNHFLAGNLGNKENIKNRYVLHGYCHFYTWGIK